MAVLPLWRDNYRVNVMTGSDVTSVHSPHTYFLQVGDRGEIVAPLLEGIVVGNGGTPERGLEIRLRMGTAKEMRARPHFADGRQALSIVGEIDAF